MFAFHFLIVFCFLFVVWTCLDLCWFAQFGVVDIRGNGRAFVAMKETGGMTLNVSHIYNYILYSCLVFGCLWCLILCELYSFIARQRHDWKRCSAKRSVWYMVLVPAKPHSVETWRVPVRPCSERSANMCKQTTISGAQWCPHFPTAFSMRYAGWWLCSLLGKSRLWRRCLCHCPHAAAQCGGSWASWDVLICYVHW